MAKSDETTELLNSFVHLARLAIAGQNEDVNLLVQRVSRRLRREHPEAAQQLAAVLREAPVRSSPLRWAEAPPVDRDTRLALVQIEDEGLPDIPPILDKQSQHLVDQIVEERRQQDRLAVAGLSPARTVLLTGAPGVGKTLAARWLAKEIGLPLLILDLSSVMSSFLGRTGTNLRHVLDYARENRCVLLLDELDAIAKRRHDDTDIGELKRLVTVLLQQIDSWPADQGLLVGATNHPDLLDPAVWRRFDVVIDLPLPDDRSRHRAIERFGGKTLSTEVMNTFVASTRGLSFSDIERQLQRAQRAAALSDKPLEDELLNSVSAEIHRLEPSTRRKIARDLVRGGEMSQRKAYEVTGVSRDTIRADVRKQSDELSIADA